MQDSKLFEHFIKLNSNELTFEDFKSILNNISIPDQISIGPFVATIATDQNNYLNFFNNIDTHLKDELKKWEKYPDKQVLYCQAKHAPTIQGKLLFSHIVSLEPEKHSTFISIYRTNVTRGHLIYKGSKAKLVNALLIRSVIGYVLFHRNIFALESIDLNSLSESLLNIPELRYTPSEKDLNEKAYDVYSKLGEDNSFMTNSNGKKVLRKVFTFSKINKSYKSFSELESDLNEACVKSSHIFGE